MDGIAKAVLSPSWHSCALIALALLAAYLWYRVAYLPYSVFKKLGIAGPPPRAFLGNASDIANGNRVLSEVQSWTKRYGKVCGFYLGASPVYLIADPDMLKQIMVKEFSSFIDRMPPYEALARQGAAAGRKIGIFLRVGEDWQQTRRIISPTFSTKKLKLMVPLVEESCTALFEKIKKVAESGESDDIWRIYGQFTMETILATAFGYKVEILRGGVEAENELIAAARRVFNMPPIGPLGVLLISLHSHFQWLTPVMSWLASLTKIRSDSKILRSAALGFVQDRRKNQKTKVKDLLQLMIDASPDDDDDDNELADSDNAEGGSQPFSSSSSSSHSKKTLSDDDIVALATGFMLAGYETTSNTLGYTSYLLALNPDKQDRLCADIDAYYEENEETSLYDAAHSIEYLDWVIQESLRIYPPGAMISRYCQKTCTIEGVTILEGSRVFVPIYTLHHSPEHWEDPEQFLPERFHPDEKVKRHPLAHMPFGWGPRNCVGLRYALMEAKMALVNILRKLKFERSPDTEVPLKTRLGITLGPVNGIHLKVVARN